MTRGRSILLVTLLAVAVLFLASNGIARLAISSAASAITGVPVTIHRMKLNLLSTRMEIEDLKVLNPHGFPDPVMAEIPRLIVDCDTRSLLTGKTHLQELRLELKEFLVEKNERGALNLDSIAVIRNKKEGKTSQGKQPPARPGSFQIDLVELKIGTVVYKDYSAGAPTRTQEFKIGIHERYEKITDPQVLVSLILVKALARTSIAQLANLDIGFLQRQAAGTLTRASQITTDLMGSTVEKASKTLKRLLPAEE